ncbi:MAG TPA: EAL domain-containing response regulator [Ramlibacter sp.]|nr:EAL domain-containing response regulator [Ramlibacter sp.]
MPCRDLRFLVVEDHPVQRRVFVSLLRGLGAQAVYEAEDGGAALEVIRDRALPIDIVLSDVDMPGMDGMELIRKMGAASSQLGLILNSALNPQLLSSVANMSLAYKVNLVGVINKPLSLVKLAPLLQTFRAARSRESQNAFTLAQIAEGLARDEFGPCFQAKVDLSTTEVVGFHAAPSWRHPEKGVLAASAFMSSVRAYGLQDQLAWLVLEQSAAQCAQWRSQGHDLDLSVSVMFSSLAESDIAARITSKVRKAGLDANRMVLGVAESAVDAGRAQALATLARLRAAGFRLAVEDFGIASMGPEQLEQISFSELKISRNLISGFQHDQSVRAGLVVALDTAHQLKLASVAQGIKSLDEWNMLQGWGCDFGEGDFISRPIQPESVLPWLKDRNGRASARSATGKGLDLGTGEPGDAPTGSDAN